MPIVTTTEWKPDELRRAVDDAAVRTQGQAAYQVMRTAQDSIDDTDSPSEAGTPPNTRGLGNKQLRAIRYDVDADGAIIGPLHSAVGEVGAVHEFGETWRGTDYPERPFMGPALEQNENRLAAMWAGSVGR